jgi:hypothetical protein
MYYFFIRNSNTSLFIFNSNEISRVGTRFVMESVRLYGRLLLKYNCLNNISIIGIEGEQKDVCAGNESNWLGIFDYA